MALTSPGITLAIEPLFGFIKPQLDIIRKIGATDFSNEAPTAGFDVKPGATVKVQLSGVSAALEYNVDSNNYLTGGTTTYGQLTATHFLQGYDLNGVNIDSGVDLARTKQKFSMRCAAGLSMAMLGALKTALNGVTTSTGVKLVASPTLAQYDALAADVSWLDRTTSTLVVNGAEWAKIKGVLHGADLSATPANAAAELGFANLVVIPGLTARACIVPMSSIAFLGRVPAIVADYKEYGTETDPDSGLSIGIVVASEQATNRLIVNGDLWFGVITAGANAAASTAGIINVGTQS